MSLAFKHIAGSLLGSVAADPLDHVSPHELFSIPLDLGFLTPGGRFTILSDLVVMMIVATVLLVLFMPPLMRRRKGSDEVGSRVPQGPATALEQICLVLRNDVAKPVLGRHTDRFIPFIWTVFFFILTTNLLGLLPLGSISTKLGTHVGGTATGNIWVTAALALLTLTLVVVNGLRFSGTAYLAHFNPLPKRLVPEDAPKPLRIFTAFLKVGLVPLMIVVELFGLIFKIAALAIRLFANMLAGHILLAWLLNFIFMASAASILLGSVLAVPVVVMSAAITCLEMLVAFIQAIIFTFLTAVFIGQAVLLHHDEDHAEAH